jgi:predicted kinase
MPRFTPKDPVLYIFSGLPGSGKSTIARLVAMRLKAAYLRIDTIEQGLRDLAGITALEGEGYRLSYRIASENLNLGLSVVADSCNPIELTRREWEEVARNSKAHFINIEIVCSDRSEHRRRVETRLPTVQRLKLPTWEEVENREYHEWTVGRIVVDTAHRSEQESAEGLLAEIENLA